MLYSTLASDLFHGAAGPFDELLVVLISVAAWSIVIYYYLRDRKRRAGADKHDKHDLKARKQSLEEGKEHQHEG